MRAYPLIKKKLPLLLLLKQIFNKSRAVSIKKVADFDSVDFISLTTKSLENGREPDTLEELINLSRGIVGMGGSNFPLSKKLELFNKTSPAKRILILNGVECDPGLFHDQWIVVNLYSKINRAVSTLKRVLELDEVYLTVKYSVPEINYPDLKVVRVPDTYPIGEERLLIKRILDIDIDNKEFPVNRGILVQNIQTVYKLYNAIYQPGDMDKQFITYRDNRNFKTLVILCKKGTKISEITRESDIYIGGGIMQAYKTDINNSITEKVNFISSGLNREFKESRCRGCKLCSTYCPVNLELEKVGKNININDNSRCMKCGTCSYICPADIDLCSRVKEI